MTDSETRVLARTAAVLLVVSAVRYGWEAHRGPPDLPSPSDEGPGLLAESRRLKEEGDARGRPLGAGERIDPNRASEVELDRLPGPRLLERSWPRGGGSGPLARPRTC